MRQRYIEVHGSDHERGLQIGRLMKYEILTYFANRVRNYRERRIDFGRWKDKAKETLPIIEKYAPRTLNEMRGMAEGAEVDLETILELNTYSDITIDPMSTERCTTFSVTGQATKHGGTICGQNNDGTLDIGLGGDLDKVICHKAADNTQALIYTKPGYPAMMGMNNSGLGVLANAIDNGERQLGLPFTIIIRELLNHTSLNQAVKYLQTLPHHNPQNFMLTHNKEGICNIECYPTSTHVVSNEISLCHSNHILTEEKSLNDVANRKEFTGSTFNRLKVMQELLKKFEGKIDIEIAKSFLADHSGAPLSICTHPRIDNPLVTTSAAMVFDLEKLQMHIAFGNPCEWSYHEYSL